MNTWLILVLFVHKYIKRLLLKPFYLNFPNKVGPESNLQAPNQQGFSIEGIYAQ